MSEFFVHNSLNTSKSVKFNMTLRYFVILEERGEHCWTLEIGTTHSGIDGTTPLSKKVHRISAEDLDEVIEETISDLCSKIDWSPYVIDKWAPYISEIRPSDNDENALIGSDIYFRIKDKLPTAGIDLSGMRVTLNNGVEDFDISDEIIVDGDPYDYECRWTPKLRIYDTYD